MQVQAQLNRIKVLADNSNSRKRYSRLRRAIYAAERDRGYRVYNGEKLSVLTGRQSERIESMPMQSVHGRNQAIRRAAAGGSVG